MGRATDAEWRGAPRLGLSRRPPDKSGGYTAETVDLKVDGYTCRRSAFGVHRSVDTLRARLADAARREGGFVRPVW